MLPTILFTPQFGAETAVDGHGIKVRDPAIQLIFWGSFWRTPTGVSQYLADINDTANIVNSSYFNAVSQYVGGTPNVSFPTPALDVSTDPTPGFYTDETLVPLLVTEIQNAINAHLVGGPAGYGSFQPMYAVVTPPSVQDFGVGGFNTSSWFYSANYTEPIAYMPYVWIGTEPFGTPYSQAIGHEVAEAMTDPWGDKNGVELVNPPSPTSRQIGDNEAQDHTYTLGSPTGPLVQSLWSQADGAYLVTDGTAQTFWVTDGTLVVQGDQFRRGYNNTINISLDAEGVVHVTLDGEMVWFDSAAVNNVRVIAGSGTDTISIEEATGFATSGIGVQVQLGSGNDTVNITPNGGNLSAIVQPIAITGGGGYATVNFNDAYDPSASAITINPGSLTFGEQTIATFSGLSQASLIAGSGPRTVNVFGTTVPWTVDLGPGPDFVNVGSPSQGLASIRGVVRVNGGAGKNLLVLDDRADPNNVRYVVDGSVAVSTVSVPVLYSNVAIALLAGSGNDDIQVAPVTHTLASFAGDLDIIGGSGSNTLTVHDEQHAAPSVFYYGPWYTVTSQFIARNAHATSGNSVASLAVVYKSMTSVTLDTDALGSPVNVERTAGGTTTTVNVGGGNTTVSVALTDETLADLAGTLSINGGTGSTSLVIHDEHHAPAPSYPGFAEAWYYRVGSSYVSHGLNWPYLPLAGDATILFQSVSGGVTLDTDGNGSNPYIDGTAAGVPTTLNIGGGNPTVTVSLMDQTLSDLPGTLSINGGTGSTSLVIHDEHHAPAPSYPGFAEAWYYRVGSSYVSHGLNWPYLPLAGDATILFQSLTGGVTLDTDNNGSAVYFDGSSVPTTVNIGSGNTPVTVSLMDQNLNNYLSDLTLNGGAGVDTLSVHDEQHPPNPLTRFYRVTSWYTVTAGAVARSLRSSLLPVTFTRTINYQRFRGGVTLNTDNNGTPVYVSGAPGSSPIWINGGTGTNTLSGPNVVDTWSLTGANSGALDARVNFSRFANLVGGTTANAFDFAPGGSLTGWIQGQGGDNLLNYARLGTSVSVDLSMGTATGVAGGVWNIQAVIGGAGNDVLTAGNTPALLIGGGGADRLNGGTAASLLVGGGTAYDLNDTALEAIVAEWERTDVTFNQRVQDLTQGGGLNGAYVLTAATVNDDGQTNMLTLGSGQGWVLARPRDTVVGAKPGAIITWL